MRAESSAKEVVERTEEIQKLREEIGSRTAELENVRAELDTVRAQVARAPETGRQQQIEELQQLLVQYEEELDDREQEWKMILGAFDLFRNPEVTSVPALIAHIKTIEAEYLSMQYKYTNSITESTPEQSPVSHSRSTPSSPKENEDQQDVIAANKVSMSSFNNKYECTGQNLVTHDMIGYHRRAAARNSASQLSRRRNARKAGEQGSS